MRTCFHCAYEGYTGGLVIGNESGSGLGFYPTEEIRGYRNINVWCAQDESIWDRQEEAEYTYGWSENFGTGADGARLEYIRGGVFEETADGVTLWSENAGGCYTVTKAATTRADAHWWIVATKITNRCDHAVHFDFFSGEDPWLGLYESSEGDVGWTPDGLIRFETVLPPRSFTRGGFYDLGNRAVDEEEGRYSGQANFIEIDPASPLPDSTIFANAFAHSLADVETTRPLDNESLTAMNLGWTDIRLEPSQAFTVAMAMGLAVTTDALAIPTTPAILDEDWSVWRSVLPSNAGASELSGVHFAAEEVTLDVEATATTVSAIYVLVNRSPSSTALSIRYPVAVAADLPAPSTIAVDGVSMTPELGADGYGAVTFPVSLPPRSLRRFRVNYTQPSLEKRAQYLVTTTRQWGRPIGRSVFVIRHPASLGEVDISLPVSDVREEEGQVIHRVSIREFWPDEELEVRW